MITSKSLQQPLLFHCKLDEHTYVKLKSKDEGIISGKYILSKKYISKCPLQNVVNLINGLKAVFASNIHQS